MILQPHSRIARPRARVVRPDCGIDPKRMSETLHAMRMGLGLSLTSGPMVAGAPTMQSIWGANLLRLYVSGFSLGETDATYVDDSLHVNAVQTVTANRPTASTINGHVCANFRNLQDQWLDATPSGSVDLVTTKFSVGAVVSGSAVASTRLILAKYFLSTRFGLGCVQEHANKFAFFTNARANAAVSDATHNDGAVYVLGASYNAAKTPTTKLWVNKVLQTATFTDATGIAAHSDRVGFGAGIDSTGGSRTNGWIGNIGFVWLANEEDDTKMGQSNDLMAAWAGV